MNIINALRSVSLFHKKEPLNALLTPWGEHLDPNHVLSEYPRPQMVRDSYICLNGLWEYAITRSAVCPKRFDGRILVPFSPESRLSGVSRQLMPDEFLWYKKKLPIHKLPEGMRCILHFGAVDQCAAVFINGRRVLRHVGGYWPFEADITPYLKGRSDYLHVCVQDYSDTSWHSRGKQKLKRGGMFYTAQSGIWQTVWLEWVPDLYIQSLQIRPDYDKRTVQIHVQSRKRPDSRLTYEIYAESRLIYRLTTSSDTVSLPVSELHSWTPDTPFLYDLKVKLGYDCVQSYFGMRTLTVEPDAQQIPRICLNHRPLYMHGVLDQGYWPDGLYTAPSDEAMIFDIQKMKDLGFNMIRKHLKIEPARWYYHCDRLGMIVWQDMVNGGTAYYTPFVTWLPALFTSMKSSVSDTHHRLFSRKELSGRREWLRECQKTITYLSHFCSISTWVIFNEGWGQFNAKQVTAYVRRFDKSRLIDAASGWFDQGCGDFKSEHNYFDKLQIIADKRPFVLSEYGGYAFRVSGHSSVKKIYGYKIYKNAGSFRKDFYSLMTKSVYPLIEKGLCATVYTQLSDVEEEVNGLLTYDRKICKLNR